MVLEDISLPIAENVIDDKKSLEQNQNSIQIENVVKEVSKNVIEDSNETENKNLETKVIQNINQARNKKQRIRKRISIAFSDSEDDLEDVNADLQPGLKDIPDSATPEIYPQSITNIRKRTTILQSDSESESELPLVIDEGITNGSKLALSDTDDENSKLESAVINTTRKKFNFDDSDSDNETDKITPHDKSFSDEQPHESPIYAVNSKGELTAESSAIKSSNWTALCDSESSGPDENIADSDNDEKSASEKNYFSEDEVIKPVLYKRKKKVKNGDEPEQMTAKQAAQLRTEIQSESQRMVRETRVSLPYHRPKSFTLKEFLSRRPKFASAVPLDTKASASVAMKMSTEQLEIIAKKLKERHKAVQQFYKSDSEEDEIEDKEDIDYVPPKSDINDKNTDNEFMSITDKDSEVTESGIKVDKCDREFDKLVNKDDVPFGVDHHDKISIESNSSDKKSCNEDDVPCEVDNINDKISIESNSSDKKSCNEDDVPCEADNINDKIWIESNSSDKKSCNEDDMPCEVDNINDKISIESNNISDKNGIPLHSKNLDIEQKDEYNNTSHEENECTNKEITDKVFATQGLPENKKVNIISEYIFKTTNNVSDIDPTSNENKLQKSSNTEHNDDIEDDAMDYDFSLDDIEEQSEKVLYNETDNIEKPVEVIAEGAQQESEPHTETTSLENNSNKFDYGELHKEVENFEKEQAELEKPKSRLELLRERLSNSKPRLSSDSGNLINLDSVGKPNGVIELMYRFAQHTAKKQIHKEKVTMNIVSVETGGEIHKEVIALNVSDEEDLSIEEKPGVRLQRLRNELQTEIARRKSELWQNRMSKDVTPNESNIYDGEKSECGADDAVLDNDEEEEMSESSEEDEEELIDEDMEEEKEDVEEEKRKKKSVFLDDEAEDSDREVMESDDEDEDNLEADDERDDNEDDDQNNDEDKENDYPGDIKNDDFDKKENLDKKGSEDTSTMLPRKPLKRILKGFFDDDSDDEEFSLPNEVVDKIAQKLNRIHEDTNTQDDYIRPYQVETQNKTPVKKSFSEASNSDTKFLTPVSYITGLQTLTNSASKLQSPANIPSPLKDMDWRTELQNKLNANSIITNSQAQAMAELCSEKFPESQQSIKEPDPNVHLSNIPIEITPTYPSNTQDILNICSGGFDEPTPSDFQATVAPSTQELLNLCSGKFVDELQVSESLPSRTATHHLNEVEEVKTLDEDQDMIISQLLNEEEMEAFKKKFDSPVTPHTQKVVEAEEVAAGGGILDSDEDDEILEVKKKKNQKKLTFSDDSSEEEDEQEEEIELHDDIDEGDDEDRPAGEINYDSEENEVEYTENPEKEKLKLTDFFENEAELSESEWGSADEDEKDLDTLEFEQGDEEKFDEKQMRTDLERIHMRRMLDDDTREVKLLQEMLLDDGELHGTGRERQFRWKNLDSMDLQDEERKNSDDEIVFDEDENKEQWRRKRHEREMFLKEKQSQEIIEDNDLLSGSEILKIGHKVIQRSTSNSQGSQGKNVSPENTDIQGSPTVKTILGLVHKRGSFLSRGEQMLQRIAEYNKTSSTTVVHGKVAKNSKNFLFQTVVTEDTVNNTSVLNLKRKGVDGTPKVLKKLRLSDNLSPALRKKRNSNLQTKTKLFGVS